MFQQYMVKIVHFLIGQNRKVFFLKTPRDEQGHNQFYYELLQFLTNQMEIHIQCPTPL
mgnify:CR=1 FL=1